MNEKLKLCLVPVTGTLLDAMRSLDQSGVEIVLLVDEANRVEGVLTDGDIRRALLKGAAFDSPVAAYRHRRFAAVGPAEGRAEVLDLMLARGLRQIPVIDSAGRVAGLHLLHEMVSKQQRPNWAVIMAGGKGTRLRPITEQVPKPMIPVAGRPILERLVLHLVSYGIERVFISLNYLGHVIEEHFGDGVRFGCRIDYLRETKPLGTGGALALLPQVPGAPFLVLNGDLVTQFDAGAMLDEHERSKNAITVGLRQYAHTIPYGCAQVGESGIEGFEEKPTLMRMVNAGIYVLDPRTLGRIPREVQFPITELIEGCIQRKERVGAFELAGDWIDVGQWDQLKRARGTTEHD